jgi:RHS repeat-associated protein
VPSRLRQFVRVAGQGLKRDERAVKIRALWLMLMGGNGLGQLVRVDEPDASNSLGTTDSPVQPTSYTYDALGNLTQVNQGSQTRTFVYSSLARLLSATNPESATISYQYDNNGNLTQKTDARPVSTSYVYDALNRVTSRSYSDDTPAVTYSYDSAGIANGKGRLASESSSVASYSYSGYDALGRVSGGAQTLGSQTYSLSYGYDRAGHVLSETYPSGRTVTNAYDGAGRLNSFTGNLGDGTARTYATGVSYDAGSRMTQEQFGTDTAIYNKLFYNSRGQLSEIRESTTGNDTSWNRGAIINHYSDNCWGMCYDGSSQNPSQGMPDNNGNLKKQDNYVPDNEQVTSYHTFTDSYAYDSLNRLQTVTETNYVSSTNQTTTPWQQSYTYDRYGNRKIDQANTWGGVNSMQAAVAPNTTTNRLYAPGETEQNHPLNDYDNAGNQKKDYYSDPYGVHYDRIYDAENRMIQSTATYSSPPSTQVSTYAYDGDGHRVKRNIVGTETWQVYGLGGELIAEYAANTSSSSPQKEYGYRNGQLLVTAAAPSRVNVALASNGGVASASSTTPVSDGWGTFEPLSANNGDRLGLGIVNDISNNSFWRDGTNNAWPDWLQIDFNGSKSIDEIDVYTLQDNYANPATPTQSMTFNNQGIVDFSVQYWDGANWVTVPNGSVTGNNKVWRQFAFTAVTTTKIRVTVNNALNSRSRIVELEAWGNTGPPPLRTNVALGANGGVATASSTTPLSDGWGTFEPLSANNGDRLGLGIVNDISNNSFWRDGTNNAWPDWLQIDFNGSKSIDEIDVYTMQDNYANPATPTQSMTFNNQGIVDFNVQYWDGANWATASNGSVTGNNKVWRQFAFTAVTTTKIRVTVNNALNSRSRIVELEAWGTAASLGGAAADIEWLVTDQLGTPRMIFDKTGSLANTKRHDYLPFGEELFATQGLRTGTMGYSVNDTVRQKFTQKERDAETGLDYFGARYYANTQGRFTGADPLLSSGHPSAPQTWNRFSYALNNPLRYIDPSGLYVFADGTSTEQQDAFNNALEQARKNLKAYGAKYGTDSKEYKKAARALEAYGEKGIDNGVTVGAEEGPGAGRVVPGRSKQIHVNFDSAAFKTGTFADLIGHEGSHIADKREWIDSGFKDSTNPTEYQTEFDAFTVMGVLGQARHLDEPPGPANRTEVSLPGAVVAGRKGYNPTFYAPERVDLWNSSWAPADVATMRGKGINTILARPKNAGGDYEMLPTDKKKAF